MRMLIDTNRYSDFAKGEKTAVEIFTTANRIPASANEQNCYNTR